MNLLFIKLDKIFQSEAIDEAYNTYLKFISFISGNGWNEYEWLHFAKRTSPPKNHATWYEISRFSTYFQHLHQKMMKHDMELPDVVLTFKVLDGARVTDDERKLTLTISNNLNFEQMKSNFNPKWRC